MSDFKKRFRGDLSDRVVLGFVSFLISTTTIFFIAQNIEADISLWNPLKVYIALIGIFLFLVDRVYVIYLKGKRGS